MRSIRTVLLAASATLLVAAAAVAQDDQSSVTGRMLLPEGASLESAAAWTVLIADAAAADALAAVVGAAGGPVSDPAATEIPFAAGYDASSIDESAIYVLDARIMDAAGNLLFTHDTAVPVITNGAPVDAVDVPMVAAEPTAGEARVIELEADVALRFLQDGEQITQIPVTPGETVLFRIDNTAGFAHNFYIGADEELAVSGGTTAVGIPDWETGVKELEWIVPDDISGLRFACTFPGHYFVMQGDFVVAQ